MKLYKIVFQTNESYEVEKIFADEKKCDCYFASLGLVDKMFRHKEEFETDDNSVELTPIYTHVNLVFKYYEQNGSLELYAKHIAPTTTIEKPHQYFHSRKSLFVDYDYTFEVAFDEEEFDEKNLLTYVKEKVLPLWYYTSETKTGRRYDVKNILIS